MADGRCATCGLWEYTNVITSLQGAGRFRSLPTHPLTEGLSCFWSRSRKEYWVKGLTSGNTQKVVRVAVDCDQDCLLVVVEQQGDAVACHTGKRTCYYRELAAGTDQLTELDADRPHHQM